MGVMAPHLIVRCPVALVGAGRMAREHARACADVRGVSLAGIQSRTRARAVGLAAEYGIARVTDSLGDVHGRPWTSVADAFESRGWRILSRHAVPVHGSLARLLVHAQAF